MAAPSHLNYAAAPLAAQTSPSSRRTGADPIARPQSRRLVGAAKGVEGGGDDAGGVLGPGVVRAVCGVVNRQRALRKRKCFARTIGHQKQARVMRSETLGQRIFRSERSFTDGDRTLKHPLGARNFSKISQDPGQIAEARRCIRMLRAKRLLANRQRALVKMVWDRWGTGDAPISR